PVATDAAPNYQMVRRFQLIAVDGSVERFCGPGCCQFRQHSGFSARNRPRALPNFGARFVARIGTNNPTRSTLDGSSLAQTCGRMVGHRYSACGSKPVTNAGTTAAIGGIEATVELHACVCVA